MIVAFYVHKQSYMTTSFMKVGGYDPEGFDSNSAINTMETLANTSWALNLIQYTYDVSNLETDARVLKISEQRRFVIDPSFPFMYIPPADFAALIGNLRTQMADLEQKGLYDSKTILGDRYIKFN